MGDWRGAVEGESSAVARSYAIVSTRGGERSRRQCRREPGMGKGVNKGERSPVARSPVGGGDLPLGILALVDASICFAIRRLRVWCVVLVNMEEFAINFRRSRSTIHWQPWEPEGPATTRPLQTKHQTLSRQDPAPPRASMGGSAGRHCPHRPARGSPHSGDLPCSCSRPRSPRSDHQIQDVTGNLTLFIYSAALKKKEK